MSKPLEGHITFQLTLRRRAHFCECVDSVVAIQNQSYSFTWLVNKWQSTQFICIFLKIKKLHFKVETRIGIIGKGILTSSGQHYVLSTGNSLRTRRDETFFTWEKLFISPLFLELIILDTFLELRR